MASVSLVGQHPCPHRLDSEPQLFLPKLTATGIKKFILPRKSSLEKMMFRKSSGSGECGSATNKAVTDSAASVGSLNGSFSPAQRDDKSRTGGEQTGRGCGIQSETPRSPVGDTEHGTVCDTSSSNSERETNRGGEGAPKPSAGDFTLKSSFFSPPPRCPFPPIRKPPEPGHP